MFKKIIFSRPLILSFSIITGIGIASAAFLQFSGTAGISHVLGQFKGDGSGNAGTVSFDEPSLSKAGINGLDITGKFWIETIGWATFDPGAQIHAPSSSNVTDLWSVTGTASSNAGSITLDGTVQYDPKTKTLVGYGTNNGIGKIPFGTLSTTTTVPTTGITSTRSSQGFEGRVKIIGNIGGNSNFDTFYSLGSRFNASIMNDTLNRIRKNISLLTRNIPSGFTNTTFGSTSPSQLGNKLFFINNGTTLYTLTYDDIDADFPTSSVDSLIIIGGDLVIDRDMNTTGTNPKGVIVLKNESGVGGNIIVNGSVKKIESSIFAEGTLYSGTGITDLANDTAEKVALLPENQLYIHGSLMSRNTIGGATQSGNPTCVYNENSCSYQKSIQYDLNYFRSYLSGTVATRAHPDATYDDYSLIIERDSRISTNPPPGFEMR